MECLGELFEVVLDEFLAAGGGLDGDASAIAGGVADASGEVAGPEAVDEFRDAVAGEGKRGAGFAGVGPLRRWVRWCRATYSLWVIPARARAWAVICWHPASRAKLFTRLGKRKLSKNGVRTCRIAECSLLCSPSATSLAL